MSGPRPNVTGDTTQLAAPPTVYEQFDESQTRREVERSFGSVNRRIDTVEDIILQLVVTEGVITQTAATDLFVLVAGVPEPLDMPTTLTTLVSNRWSEPTDGTLRYTGQLFTRLGLIFGFVQIIPNANNRTFVVDLLINDVVQRSIEFQTGTAGLAYPVSISGSIPFPVGDTDIRMQITCTTSLSIDVEAFTISALDMFSASALELDSVATSSLNYELPIIAGPSLIQTLFNSLAGLIETGVLNPFGANLDKHFISGPIGSLATGYAQQRGSGTIVISAVDVWESVDPVTTLGVNSSQWTQPADAELTLITDTKRICSVDLVMILDTAAANQSFEFRLLLNGTPTGGLMPYTVPLSGNNPQEHTLGFLVELPIGETTLSFEVRNTVSGQDLVIEDFAMAITDNLADG